jgi:hypothetical protein
MRSEQKEFLERRLREAAEKQPEIKLLANLLVELGGQFLVAPPGADFYISNLLEFGFVMSGPVQLNIMRANSCHQNVSLLWKDRKLGMVGIGTGYALSDDGLWRRHSWGVLREGIVETTDNRVKYFGLLLQGSRASQFADRNSSGTSESD